MKRISVNGTLSRLSAGVVVAALLGPGIAQASQSGRPKPNIVLILSDDQGWADLACQGPRSDVRTPHLDALAADGVRFSRGYVSAPQCSPSRAGLLTGRYQTRFRFETNDDGPLPSSERTIGDRLKEAGYVTGMVGKWHVAGNIASEAAAKKSGRRDVLWGDNVTVDNANLPGRRGFDEYFCGAMQNYAASYALSGATLPNAPVLVREPRFRVDIQTEAALAFIRRRAAKPFFLYVAYFAPHVPLDCPEKYTSRFAGVTDPIRRAGLGLISAMDDGIGRIRRALQDHGIANNTLVIFLSDNGAPTKPGMWDGSLNEPLIGEKGMLTDGGSRLPFVMAWPGRIPAGKVFEHAVSSLDLLPTALAAAGSEVRKEWKLDGVDLLPHLTGQRDGPPHDALFWRWRSEAAVLSGRWKLIFLAPDHWMLFDATAPLGETRNVATDHPQVVSDLRGRLQAWCDEQDPPGLPKHLHPNDKEAFVRHRLIGVTNP